MEKMHKVIEFNLAYVFWISDKSFCTLRDIIYCLRASDPVNEDTIPGFTFFICSYMINIFDLTMEFYIIQG